MLIMKKILSVVGIIGEHFSFWLQQSAWKHGSLIRHMQRIWKISGLIMCVVLGIFRGDLDCVRNPDTPSAKVLSRI